MKKLFLSFFMCLFIALPSIAQAKLLLPEIYLSVAGLTDRTNADFPTGGIKDATFKSNGYNVAVGIRPIPDIVPILSGLRLEGQYMGYDSNKTKLSTGDSAKTKNTGGGFGIYLDLFRFLPIVNPYIGYTTQHIKSNINTTANLPSKKYSYWLHSAAFGVSAEIPATKLSFFGEYTIGTGDYSHSNSTFNNILDQKFLLGARYSFF